jgi:hypothetical protein
LVVATLLTGYYIVPSVFPVESLPSLFPGLLPRAEKMNLGLDFSNLGTTFDIAGGRDNESTG